MKAILYLLILGSSYLVSDALLSQLLGLRPGSGSGGNCDEICAKPSACVGGACFRNIDGSCNNVNKPSMGMAGMPYGRLCQDCYSDGKSALPKSKSGKALPNARKVSWTLFPEKPCDDDEISQLAQPYGQFIAHDLSLTSGVSQMNRHLISCCDKDKNTLAKILTDPRCAPILIPKGDPVYNYDDTPCLELVRTTTTHDKRCQSPHSSYTPISDVTAWLDASNIYGNSENETKKLREFNGGRLLAVMRNGQEWPPQQPEPTKACSGQSATEPCYLAGDFRVNQSPQLTLLHVVYLREHNRLCQELSTLNPCWDDEKLFQVARRILIATHQHITYCHYLPICIGQDRAVKEKFSYCSVDAGWVDDYDCSTNASIILEFATAAFRFYHTMVHGCIGLYDEDRQQTSSIFLRNSYFKAAILEQNNNLQGLSLGCASQAVRMSDQYCDVDITQYLFSLGNNELGNDLRALDIQRSREHGVCKYTDVRKACGLPVPTCFEDLLTYGISQENVDKLKELYECYDDIELVVGGMLEPIEPGARAGLTYLCVLANQFYRTRTGDRYFYQNGQEHVSFTLDQLRAIQAGTSVSRLFCDNVKDIKSMQPDAFRQVKTDNPLTPCDQLPKLDLKYWINSEC